MKSRLSISKYLLIGAGALLSTALIVTGISSANWNRTFRNKVERLFERQQEVERSVITENDIKDLPEPVQRYMRWTGVIGKERVSFVRLKQTGFMRPTPDGKWIPLKAEQYYTVNDPGFVWFGSLSYAPLVTASAQDMYVDGKGNMHIKLLSTVTVLDAKDSAMDEASLMRFFNEMQWFPTALVSDKVKWESIDEKSARATMTDHGITVSAEFHFDEQGRLTNFIAERGRDTGGGNLVMTRWSTPISEYATFNGLRLPNKGEAIWHLESGEYSYGRLEITDIEYDKPEMY